MSRVVDRYRHGDWPISSRNCEHSSGGLYLHCGHKNSLLERARRQRGPRLPCLMNAAHSWPRASTVPRLARQGMLAISPGSHASCAARSIFYPLLPRSEPCKMAQEQSRMRANPDRQDHLPAARSGGHRVPPAPNRGTLKTRKETMSDIWRSHAPKPYPATRSGQRTTTSTPNIITDRCPRNRKPHRRAVPLPRSSHFCDCLKYLKSGAGWSL
jgi:hypothetical protein